MKPLWRWTIGDVSGVGWEILSESIRQAVKVYPEFDFVICHNSLTLEQEAHLRRFNIPLCRQDDFSFFFQNRGEERRDYFWKLVPPRLRKNAHELWVDNDLVVRGRMDQLDLWLYSNTSIISTSKEMSSRYGCYSDCIDSQIKCCAGFFGLPPGFDFESKICELCSKPLKDYDEQGLVTKIVTDVPGWLQADFENLKMLGSWNAKKIGFTSKLPEGIHFVGANRAKTKNWAPWLCYKLRTTP